MQDEQGRRKNAAQGVFRQPSRLEKSASLSAFPVCGQNSENGTNFKCFRHEQSPVHPGFVKIIRHLSR